MCVEVDATNNKTLIKCSFDLSQRNENSTWRINRPVIHELDRTFIKISLELVKRIFTVRGWTRRGAFSPWREQADDQQGQLTTHGGEDVEGDRVQKVGLGCSTSPRAEFHGNRRGSWSHVTSGETIISDMRRNHQDQLLPLALQFLLHLFVIALNVVLDSWGLGWLSIISIWSVIYVDIIFATLQVGILSQTPTYVNIVAT